MRSRPFGPFSPHLILPPQGGGENEAGAPIFKWMGGNRKSQSLPLEGEGRSEVVRRDGDPKDIGTT